MSHEPQQDHAPEKRQVPRSDPSVAIDLNTESTAESGHAPLSQMLLRSEPARIAMLTRMQRQQGNTAVQRFLASSASAQRWTAPIVSLKSDEQLIADGAAGDVTAVKEVTERHIYNKASADQKLQMIGTLVGQGWVGTRDEWALETLWGSFGDVLAVARANIALWTKSVARDRDLMDLQAVKDIAPKFIEDVRGVANGYLDSNEKYCESELQKLGAGADPNQKPADQAKEMADLKDAAKVVKVALEAQDKLKGTTVGMRLDRFMGPDGHPMESWVGVQFSPNNPPTAQEANPPKEALPPDSGAQGLTKFDDVQREYDVLQAIVDGVTTKYPALYAVLSQGGAAGVNTVAGDNPEQARSMVVNSVTTVRDNIKSSRPKLQGDLPWDLQPIQQQLLSGGAKGGSGTDWADPVLGALAKAQLERHGSHQFWETLGLSTLAMAAFIIAEFATAGLASVAFVAVGVSIGVGQAAMSWDKALALASAKQAAMTKDTELVSQGQVDMAQIEALLNTALVAVDVLQGAKVVGRALGGAVLKEGFAAGSAAARAGLEGLDKVAALAPAEAKPLVERAVVEMGVDSVTKRTGLTADQLLKLVGEDSPVAARLKAFGTLPENLVKMTAEEFAERSRNLGAEIAKDRTTGEALAQLAVERLGPKEVVTRNGGWKAVSLALGNESQAGKTIMAWRDGMIGDIEAYVKTLPGGVDEAGKAAVKRTGTQGKFTNDFDVSLLGPHSSANRDAVRSFMAGRLGSSPEELEFLLLADFFTDPTRLHLYDQLAPALRAEMASRAEKTAEATIFAKTLADAEKAGNKQLAEELRAQMKSLGVAEAEFKPLATADRSALYAKIDDLHGQLEKALANNDQAAQKKLVQEIGDTQGLINAAEGGGYFSGGGTKLMVSLKEGLAKGATDLLPEQKYTALLDQLPKLYTESSNLLRGGVVATEDAVAAIKGVAKYGQRFSQIANDMGVAGFEAGKLDELATRFGKILKQAKGEADVTLLKRLEQDAEAVQGEINGLLDSFNQTSQDVLLRLSKQAGLAGKEVDLAKIQFLVMVTAKLSRTNAAIQASINQIIAGLLRMAAAGASAGADKQ